MNEDECVLEEGLEKHYDLVLLGTGLVQSILSCVASKHGKKVLHVDKNDFYGEVYGSHSLSAHLAHYAAKKTCDIPKYNPVEELRESTRNMNQFKLENNFDDIYVALYKDNISEFKRNVAPRRPLKCETYHPACFTYAMEKATEESPTSSTEINPVFRGYVNHNKLTRGRVWNKDRDFNIDTTSKVLFGSSPMVDLMIASGVGNYLEFKSFEGLYFMVEGGQDTIWKVPCSRNDVFNTTMLGALEKRSLMKFHQFVADWGRVNCGTEVASLNENELAIGRSLYRPQNKQLVTSGYNVDAFVDKPFQDFLADCKISPKLQHIIIYALCCHKAPMRKGQECSSKEYLTRDALNDMFMHIDSIGRFGETAFLTPLYGASEVVQAFCRMSAVWGGTFILQRAFSSVAVKPAAVTEDSLSPRAPEVTPSGAPRSCVVPSLLVVTDAKGNAMSCDGFVCAASYWPGVPTRSALKVSCTSVWLGAVVPLPRSIIIIPPSADETGQIGNSHAVHIIQTDSSTNSAPDGVVVLHMSTLLEFPASSDGNNRPHWRESAALYAERARTLIDRVVSKLIGSFVENLETHSAEELSRVVTIQPVYDVHQTWASELPVGVHLCAESSDASLSMQSAHDEAKKIFLNLFPDKDFALNVVDEVSTDLPHYQNTDCENDDEATFLEFTLNSTKNQTTSVFGEEQQSNESA